MVLALVLVVVAALIGGVARIGHQSGPFDASIDRSFAVQFAVLADESNATGTFLRRLMGAMQNLDRLSLQTDLDDVTAEAGAQAAEADAVAGGGIQDQLATVFADRADGADQVRSAIDGLLGMTSPAVAGAAQGAATPAQAPALLSSTDATNRIAAAGRLLSGADRSYQALRRALASMPGHPRLPSSAWITAPGEWRLGSVATEIDLVATSTSLEATHGLAISVAEITPPALPSPAGTVSPSVSVLSPTTSVALTVVLANRGSVDEPHASVTFTLAPQPTGVAVTSTRRASVLSMRSVSLAPVAFKVKPGGTYLLTVAVAVPPGQTDLAGTAFSQEFRVAPST